MVNLQACRWPAPHCATMNIAQDYAAASSDAGSGITLDALFAAVGLDLS